MTMKTVTVAPEYVSFYVAGSRDVDIPIEYGAAGVFGNSECPVVTCLYWNEGDTKITLGDFEGIATPRMPLRFDGILEVPSHRVVLFDVHMPEIVAADVPGSRTRVRIWTNHPTEPDDVVIALG
jgi:hypothetical protein